MVAITVVLAGTLYVWAAGLAESNTDGYASLYAFDAKEAPGTPTEATMITSNNHHESRPRYYLGSLICQAINQWCSLDHMCSSDKGGSCIVVDSSDEANIWSVEKMSQC